MSSQHSSPTHPHVTAVNLGMVYFYVYQSSGCTVCFDAGLNAGLAQRKLRALGINGSDVTDVFLTHADFDHTGGLAAFPNARVWLSALEEPLARGMQPRTFGVLRNRPLRRPYSLLQDGQQVPVGSATVRAIAAPGHTPGSMCYLVEDSLLFVGDAFRLREGRVVPSPKRFNLDTEQATETLRSLAALPAQWAFTGHSGSTSDFAAAAASWVK